MLRIEEGESTPDERMQLEACLQVSRAEGGLGALLRRVSMAAFFGLVAIATPALALSWVIGWSSAGGLLLAGPALGAAAAVWTHRRAERRRWRHLLALEEDYAGGKTQSLVVEAERAAVVRGEEGSAVGALFVELAGGELLYLQGPVLADVEDELPNSRFTVRLAPRSRIVFEIRAHGEPLEPSATLERLGAWRRGYTREDRAFLLEGTLEGIERIVHTHEFLDPLKAS